MNSMRSRRVAATAGIVVAAFCVAGLVGAFWSAGSDPGGNGHALAGRLPTGAVPSASLASRAATVTWAQSTVTDSLLGQLAGGGYVVTRYAEGALTSSIVPGAACAGTLNGPADPMSCTESSLATGRWLYTVTPRLYSWIGGESITTATLIVPPDPPLAVVLTNGAGTGSAFISTTNQSSLNFAVTLPTTSLASDTIDLVLSDGVTTVAASSAGIDGGGIRTFTGIDASSLADGPITISASATSSFGDASAPVSVVRTKDTVGPTLVSLSMRDNNSNGKVDRVLATFSESLAAYSAATTPWTLANVPSGGTLASVSVSAAVATLTITEGAGAPDTAVGSFTVALATNASGIRDAAGNLSSFAATAPADGAKPILVAGTLVMQDVNANGKVDRVQATFSETLAASTDTAPWTLTNVPSGGTLASVSTSGATATLVIAEGAGAQNTAVGTFRVVLAASATGIRDAAGNQSSLASSAPVDQATPILVSLVMQDTSANGKVDRVLATFSESLAAYSAATTPWTLANVPSRRNARLRLGLRRGRHAHDHRRRRSPRHRGRVLHHRAGHQRHRHPRCRRQSLLLRGDRARDGAKPILVAGTLVMQDVNANGKVDRVHATFSETLAASTDTAPWTLTNVPSGGTLASVSTTAATATLVIAEGAGAQPTAVGTFRVVLAASATGIRDAAGNQSCSPPPPPSTRRPRSSPRPCKTPTPTAKSTASSPPSPNRSRPTRRHHPLDARKRPLRRHARLRLGRRRGRHPHHHRRRREPRHRGRVLHDRACHQRQRHPRCRGQSLPLRGDRAC